MNRGGTVGGPMRGGSIGGGSIGGGGGGGYGRDRSPIRRDDRRMNDRGDRRYNNSFLHCH